MDWANRLLRTVTFNPNWPLGLFASFCWSSVSCRTSDNRTTNNKKCLDFFFFFCNYLDNILICAPVLCAHNTVWCKIPKNQNKMIIIWCYDCWVFCCCLVFLLCARHHRSFCVYVIQLQTQYWLNWLAFYYLLLW